jgi:transcription elongation factor GreA
MLIKEARSNIEKELKHRKEVLSPDIAKRYRQAVDDGDGMHDNPHYRNTYDELEANQREIRRLENLLETPREISDQDLNTDAVRIGSKVKIKDVVGGIIRHFTLVTSSEIDKVENAVSNESPIGQSVLDKKPNEEFNVTLPDGRVKRYKIIEIKNDE